MVIKMCFDEVLVILENFKQLCKTTILDIN